MSLRIALDAMGGDFAPAREVEAAVIAARRGIPVTLVGRARAIGEALERVEGGVPAELEVENAEDVIGMDEAPSQAVRKKRDASICRAVRLVVEGGAGAMVSAGNSGAVMAAGLIDASRIDGVQRPAIAGAFPTKRSPAVVVDLGANIDPTAVQLAQFAVMGAAYAKAILGRERPRAAILCNGSEEHKGSDLTRAAYELLERSSSVEFMGYVEGNQIFDGDVDVIATDGFTGNVVLKSLEGFAVAMRELIEREVRGNLLAGAGALLMGDIFPRVKEKLDYQGAGAAPLLGLGANVLVAHGRSTVLALANAIQTASRLVETSVIATVRDMIAADAALWSKGPARG
jgi:glycerol-3-phosphate acyltransferase PlsX